MRAGDLVRTIRASIGVPAGTIGLIIKVGEPRGLGSGLVEIFTVQLIGVLGALGYPSERRYLPRDLETVNASR
jgi:hypothetical protein